MKKKDLILVIVIVFISGVISYVLSNYLFASDKDRQEKVEVVEPISADFPAINKKYFNDKSIDPTQLITIGDNNNNKPFNEE